MEINAYEDRRSVLFTSQLALTSLGWSPLQWVYLMWSFIRTGTVYCIHHCVLSALYWAWHVCLWYDKKKYICGFPPASWHRTPKILRFCVLMSWPIGEDGLENFWMGAGGQKGLEHSVPCPTSRLRTGTRDWVQSPEANNLINFANEASIIALNSRWRVRRCPR